MIKLVEMIKSKIVAPFIYLRYKYIENDESEQPAGTLPHYEYNPLHNHKHFEHSTLDGGEKILFGKVLETDIKEGETRIVSHKANRDIANSIYLKNDNIEITSVSGKVKISNNSHNLATLLIKFIDTVAGAETFGSPAHHRISGQTISELNNLKTEAKELLEE